MIYINLYIDKMLNVGIIIIQKSLNLCTQIHKKFTPTLNTFLHQKCNTQLIFGTTVSKLVIIGALSGLHSYLLIKNNNYTEIKKK